MLKIKDNVDLKELDKFGFVYNTNNIKDCFDDTIYELVDCYVTYFGGGGRRGQEYYLFVDANRELNVYSSKPDGDGTYTDIHGTLFDLIQAGLVEKVKEEVL